MTTGSATATTAAITHEQGITLQRLSRAGGYRGPNDGVPGPNTWKALQQTVKGYGYAGHLDGDPGPATREALQRLTRPAQSHEWRKG